MTPRFRRRKADRPGEIVRAALGVFAEKGFAAARMEEVAARAGVSKGAVYLYFANKEALFRVVASQAVGPNLTAVKALASSHSGPFADLAAAAAAHLTQVAETTTLGGVVKMVVGEARNFPELARIWHEEVIVHALGALAAAVEAGQARGELKVGDPRAYALELIAPLVVGVLWRETFVPVGAPPFDLAALMRQHVDTMLRGLLPTEATA